MTFSAWIFSLLVLLVPPSRAASLPAYPGWTETAEQRTARYLSIAADLAAVVEDPAEALPFGGPRGRETTAAMLVSIANHESAFAPDVDKGPCYRAGIGGSKRCDGGASVSMWQIRVGAGKTREGWTRAELFGDRRKAIRAAMHILSSSLATCTRGPLEVRFAVYTGGACDTGQEASRDMVTRAKRLLSGHPWTPPVAAEPVAVTER